jgi:Leucine-rich repeat (LRR) protein
VVRIQRPQKSINPSNIIYEINAVCPFTLFDFQDSIGNLTKLKELDIRCNVLEKIPGRLITNHSIDCLEK